MKRLDACLLCDAPKQGWVPGNYGLAGHDCQMCAEDCEWPHYWVRLRERGVEDEVRRRLLATQARARAATTMRGRRGTRS